MVRLTDRPDMTLDVYRGRKTTIQQQQQLEKWRNLRLTQKLQKVIREIKIKVKNGYPHLGGDL